MIYLIYELEKDTDGDRFVLKAYYLNIYSGHLERSRHE